LSLNYGTPGGYGTLEPPPTAPERSQYQIPVVTNTEDTGEFTLVTTQPQWLEAGNTGRFTCSFTHDVDGVIAPAGLAVSVLDSTGNPPPATGAVGFVLSTPTLVPGTPNQYFTQVQAGAGVPAGTSYIIQWTGTYTTKAGAGPLPIKVRRNFSMMLTLQKPSFYFREVHSFG
jgi:hypothetical protein